VSHSPDDDPLITVRLVQLPIDVQVQAQQHADELTRELVLVGERMHQQGGDATNALPVRFVELVTALSHRYSMFTAEQEQQLAAAIASGAPSVDLEYTVPASVSAAAASLGDILDEADDYCRAGQLLLTLATPARLVTYRRWFLDQFVGQAAGSAPESWPDYRDRVRVG
jgi:hypothetical protein